MELYILKIKKLHLLIQTLSSFQNINLLVDQFKQLVKSIIRAKLNATINKIDLMESELRNLTAETCFLRGF